MLSLNLHSQKTPYSLSGSSQASVPSAQVKTAAAQLQRPRRHQGTNILSRSTQVVSLATCRICSDIRPSLLWFLLSSSPRIDGTGCLPRKANSTASQIARLSFYQLSPSTQAPIALGAAATQALLTCLDVTKSRSISLLH